MTESVAYTIRETPLGLLLVAGTARGVCHVRFGASEGALVAALARELPCATLVRGGTAVARWASTLAAAAAGRGDAARVPLDVAGSRFQRRVWDALRRIPRGGTLQYAEVAESLGQPSAARAVARACAANPVPLAVPCHRVVAKTGGPGGYRFGRWRKRALLAAEAKPRSAPLAAEARPRSALVAAEATPSPS
jgi:AraC family transcriptional regulator of adaptative response/methylated-DNA-[protein]-cysteine methyltransferase